MDCYTQLMRQTGHSGVVLITIASLLMLPSNSASAKRGSDDRSGLIVATGTSVLLAAGCFIGMNALRVSVNDDLDEVKRGFSTGMSQKNAQEIEDKAKTKNSFRWILLGFGSALALAGAVTFISYAATSDSAQSKPTNKFQLGVAPTRSGGVVLFQGEF